MTSRSSSREEAKQKTRAALIAAARRLFALKGYHGTGTHEIVETAGVTRGALQHHFPRKEDLFLAVFHEVQQDLAVAMPTEKDREVGEAWRNFRQAIGAFLTAASSSEIQRILLIDGPAVLGWTLWRELEAHYGLGTIVAAVEDGMAAAMIRRQRAEPLAHLMLAAIDEAALLVANAEDPASAMHDASIAIDTLFEALS